MTCKFESFLKRRTVTDDELIETIKIFFGDPPDVKDMIAMKVFAKEIERITRSRCQQVAQQAANDIGNMNRPGTLQACEEHRKKS